MIFFFDLSKLWISVENVTDGSQPVQSAAAHPGGHQTRCCCSSADVRGELISFQYIHVFRLEHFLVQPCRLHGLD